jgi:hypothetical protein
VITLSLPFSTAFTEPTDFPFHPDDAVGGFIVGLDATTIAF